MEEEKELNGSVTAEPSDVPSDNNSTEAEKPLEQAELPLSQPIEVAEETISPNSVANNNAPSKEGETVLTEIATPVKAVDPVAENETTVELEKIEPEESEGIKQEDSAPVKADPEAKLEIKPELKKKVSWQTITAIITVLLIVIVAVFLLSKRANHNNIGDDGINVSVDGQLEQGKISIIEETKEDIKVNIDSSEAAVWPKTKVVAYFGNIQKNPNSVDCSLTYPLEREIDKKYDSNMLNSVLALLDPLKSKERENGYVSSVPDGSYLKYIKLDDSGVATVNFSGNLNKAAGSCAVTAIKSQIKDTLLQFASVKSVVICIDDNCKEDEILQP